MPQRTAAMRMPKRTLGTDHFTRCLQPGLNHVERPPSITAEQVIIHQKFTCGAVSGENITVQRIAASSRVNINLFIKTNPV